MNCSLPRNMVGGSHLRRSSDDPKDTINCILFGPCPGKVTYIGEMATGGFLRGIVFTRTKGFRSLTDSLTWIQSVAPLYHRTNRLLGRRGGVARPLRRNYARILVRQVL